MKTGKFTLSIVVILTFFGLNEAIGQWVFNGVRINNTNSGNVGIGINTPGKLLDVSKNMTEPTIRVRNRGGIGGATFEMYDNNSGAIWKFKATNAGGFKIRDHANGLDVITIEPNSIANALYVNANGNVGIGTNAPFSRLSVNGNGLVGTAIYGKASTSNGRGVYGIASNTTGTNYGGYFESSSNSGRAVYGRSTNTSGTNFGGYFQAEGPTGQAVFGLAAGTTAINYGGWFKAKGIQGRGVYGEASDVNGTNYGGYFLAKSIRGRAVFGLAEYVVDGENYGGWFKGKGDVGGTGVYAWGNVYDFYADGPGTNYASASSLRWKKNIVEIDSPLEKISKLRGVYYDWIEDRGGRHDIGMIAEEVGVVIPEIVEYEKNGIDARGMDYSKLTPLLVEAMKELNRKMDHLLEENQNLKEEIDRLKNE